MPIIISNSNGGNETTVATLELARTGASYAGKTVTVESALTQAQSNITGAWPTDRILKVVKGGTIANSTAFPIAGTFQAGNHAVFVGAGLVTFTGAIDFARPEWFGDSVQKAINSLAGTVLLSKAYTTAISGGYGITIDRPVRLVSTTYYGYINDTSQADVSITATSPSATDFAIRITARNVEIDGIKIDGGVGGGITTNQGYEKITHCYIIGQAIGIKKTSSIDSFIAFNQIRSNNIGIQIVSGTTFDIYKNYIANVPGMSAAAGSKGVYIGPRTAGTITEYSGTINDNVFEYMDYGVYLAAGHGLDASNVFDNAYWAQKAIIVTGNYYEQIAVNYLYAIDTHFIEMYSVSFSTTGPRSVNWTTTGQAYRIDRYYDHNSPMSESGAYFGTSRKRNIFGDQNAVAMEGNQSTDGTYPKSVFVDGDTGLGYRIRYDAATPGLKFEQLHTDNTVLSTPLIVRDGYTVPVIPVYGAFVPAGSASLDGQIAIHEDGATHEIIWFAGGLRYKAAGTVF